MKRLHVWNIAMKTISVVPKKKKTLNVYNTKAVSLDCKILYPYVTKLHFRTSEALNNGSFNWLQEHRFSNNCRVSREVNLNL